MSKPGMKPKPLLAPSVNVRIINATVGNGKHYNLYDSHGNFIGFVITQNHDKQAWGVAIFSINYKAEVVVKELEEGKTVAIKMLNHGVTRKVVLEPVETLPSIFNYLYQPGGANEPR